MKEQKKFTLVELFLVIAIIATLAMIVFIAINPTKKRADSHNAQRRNDVNVIMNAIHEYSIENNKILPPNITTTQTEICVTTPCDNLVDLSILTDNKRYLVFMPIDPVGVSGNGAGYEVMLTSDNKLTVIAPDAELDVEIKVTR